MYCDFFFFLVLSVLLSVVFFDDEFVREVYLVKDLEKEILVLRDEKKVIFREIVEVCEICMDEYFIIEEEF